MLKNKKIPLPSQLKTNRTILTPLQEKDLHAVKNIFQEKETVRWLETPTLNKDQVKEVIQQKIDNENTITYTATTRATQKKIGLIELTNIDTRNQKAHIGYILRKQYWGRGYATELVHTVTKNAFKHLYRLTAHIHAGNTASMNVLEKNNYQEEGILQDNVIINNNRHDTYIYAALKPRWEQ